MNSIDIVAVLEAQSSRALRAWLSENRRDVEDIARVAVRPLWKAPGTVIADYGRLEVRKVSAAEFIVVDKKDHVRVYITDGPKKAKTWAAVNAPRYLWEHEEKLQREREAAYARTREAQLESQDKFHEDRAAGRVRPGGVTAGVQLWVRVSEEILNLSDASLYALAVSRGPYANDARAEVQRRVLLYRRQTFPTMNDAALADWIRLRLMKRQPWPGDPALWRLASADELQYRGVSVNRVGDLDEPEGVSLERAAETLAERFWKAEQARKERERPRTPKEQAEDRIRALRAEVAAWIDSLPETPWVRSMAKTEAPKVLTDDDMDRWSGYRTTSDLNDMADTMTKELEEAKAEIAKWLARSAKS